MLLAGRCNRQVIEISRHVCVCDDVSDVLCVLLAGRCNRQVIEISRHVLSLYELWKNYDEKKEIAVLLNKMPKPKMSPSR